MADIDEEFVEALRASDAPEALKRLVATGAQLTDVDPVNEAVELGRADLVDLLLSSNPALIEAFDPYLYWSPLRTAARRGDVAMAQHLIDLGAKVDGRNERAYNETALHDAVELGHYDVARLLIEYGADPTIKGGMGLTPLHHAKERIRTPELYELLVNARQVASAAALRRSRRKSR